VSVAYARGLLEPILAAPPAEEHSA
jgi:hypothetical protein